MNRARFGFIVAALCASFDGAAEPTDPLERLLAGCTRTKNAEELDVYLRCDDVIIGAGDVFPLQPLASWLATAQRFGGTPLAIDVDGATVPAVRSTFDGRVILRTGKAQRHFVVVAPLAKENAARVFAAALLRTNADALMIAKWVPLPRMPRDLVRALEKRRCAIARDAPGALLATCADGSRVWLESSHGDPRARLDGGFDPTEPDASVHCSVAFGVRSTSSSSLPCIALGAKAMCSVEALPAGSCLSTSVAWDGVVGELACGAPTGVDVTNASACRAAFPAK